MQITHEQLTSLLHYNRDTGVFTWLERRVTTEHFRTDRSWNARYANKTAGCPGPQGYHRIVLTLDGRKHYIRTNRLAWFYVTAHWPPPWTDVDHIDMDITNNRFANLRLATRSQNNANSKAPRHNTSGKKGVIFDVARGQWRAEICKDGTRMYLGRFDSFEDACDVRRRKAIDLFGEFARED